jgi:hypothetical protein
MDISLSLNSRRRRGPSAPAADQGGRERRWTCLPAGCGTKNGGTVTAAAGDASPTSAYSLGPGGVQPLLPSLHFDQGHLHRMTSRLPMASVV